MLTVEPVEIIMICINGGECIFDREYISQIFCY